MYLFCPNFCLYHTFCCCCIIHSIFIYPINPYWVFLCEFKILIHSIGVFFLPPWKCNSKSNSTKVFNYVLCNFVDPKSSEENYKIRYTDFPQIYKKERFCFFNVNKNIFTNYLNLLHDATGNSLISYTTFPISKSCFHNIVCSVIYPLCSWSSNCFRAFRLVIENFTQHFILTI